MKVRGAVALFPVPSFVGKYGVTWVERKQKTGETQASEVVSLCGKGVG
jgi:hypothetical protein